MVTRNAVDLALADLRWELRERVAWPAVEFGEERDPGDGGVVRLGRPATVVRGGSSAGQAADHWLSGV